MSTKSRSSWIAARLLSPGLSGAAGSLAAGLCLWGWSRQALAVVGTSRQSVTALVATLCLSLLAARWLLQGRARSAAADAAQRIVYMVLCAAAVAGICSVFSSASASAASGLIGLFARYVDIAPVSGRLLVPAGVCLLAWGLPATAAICLTLHADPRVASGEGRGFPGRSLVLCGLGIACCEFLAAGFGGIDRALLLSGLLCAWMIAGLLWSPGSIADRERSVVPEASVAGARPPEKFTWLCGNTALVTLLAVLHGSLILFLMRLIDQLVLPVSWTDAIAIAAVVGGCGVGGLLFDRSAARQQAGTARQLGSRRQRGPGLGRRLIWRVDPVVVSVASSLLTVGSFELLIWLMLRVRGEVISVGLSTALISAGILAVIGPVGAAAGGLIAQTDGGVPRRDVVLWILVSLAVGWLLARWAAPYVGLPSTAVLLVLGLMTLVSLCERLLRCGWRNPVLWRWMAGAAAVASVCVLASPQRTAALAARLLYDTRVFIASQVEERTDTLPYLDEARCVAVRETSGGTVTVWKRRACEFEIRRSGIPLGTVSLDLFLTPQRPGEILKTVLPLCLHPSAQNLLLLGADGGAALETASLFPLRNITLVEPDSVLVDELSRQVFRHLPLDPLKDERVQVIESDPSIAVRSAAGGFDVILLNGTQPAFVDESAESTVEFLAAAAARLQEGGLCCQPVDMVDLGPESLGSVIHAWQAAFDEVTAFEIGPGRLLLVGRTDADSSELFDGAEFLKRLQRPHVRTVLAGLGWDWSTVLKVMAYSDNDLRAAFPSTGRRLNTVSSMAFTATLPFEITRWGPKHRRTLARLAEVAATVQFMTGTAGQDPDIKRRLADLQEQVDLVHDKPDHYWAYRGRVKERIKSAPQSELIQVKGEAPHHALSRTERRRIEYFETLGQAAGQQRPSAEMLNAVAAFDSPYDPLISPFLHQEIAELAERDPDNLAGIELWHRMHRAFFASPADRSVRNVARSLELLSERPELIPDAASRGDCLDALLQVLHNRWHNRGDIPPDSSQIVLNDIEASLAAIESAFGELARLSSARGMPVDAWPARRLAVEKSLVRPLEAYRSMLLPRHARRQREARHNGAG